MREAFIEYIRHICTYKGDIPPLLPLDISIELKRNFLSSYIPLWLYESIPLQVFPATCRKYFKFKTTYYQVNYNVSENPTYFPATCLKYNYFIEGKPYSGYIPLQLDRKWF